MKRNQNKSNFIWNIIGLTFNSFNSFFFLIIVNRINGIDTAGMFVYGFAVACSLFVISTYYNRVYQISNNTITDINFIKIRMTFCLIMVMFSILVSIISTSNIEKIFIIILLCLFRNIEALSDSFYGIIHKNNYLDYVGKSLFIKAIVGVVLFLLIDLITKNIIMSLLMLILVNAIITIFDYKRCTKYLVYNNIDFNKQFKIVVKQAFPIFIFSFLSIFLLNCQKYIIGFICDETIQTIFGIIIMPATIMCLCGQYLVNPFLNLLTEKFRKKDFVDFKKVTFKLLLLLFIGGMVISGISYFISTPIMNMFYGINLDSYKMMISLIIIAATFYSLVSILSACLTIINKNKLQLIIYFITSIISIIISFVQISDRSISGAVTAYFIIMIILFIIYLICYKYYLGRMTK